MACAGVTPLPLIGCCDNRPATCAYLDGTPIVAYRLTATQEDSSFTRNRIVRNGQNQCIPELAQRFSSFTTSRPFFNHIITDRINFNPWTKLGEYHSEREDGLVLINNQGGSINGIETGVHPAGDSDTTCVTPNPEDVFSGGIDPGGYLDAADELIDWLEFDSLFPETTIADWRTAILSPRTVAGGKDAGGANRLGANVLFGTVPGNFGLTFEQIKCAIAYRTNGLVDWFPSNDNKGYLFSRQKIRVLTESPYWLVHYTAPVVASADGISVYGGGAYDPPVCQQMFVPTPFGGRAWVDIPVPGGDWNVTAYFPYAPSFC